MNLRSAIYTCMAFALAGCASTVGSPSWKADRCSAIAEVARSQYGYGPESLFPLSEDSWGTDCNWTANGVPIEIIREGDFDFDRLLIGVFYFDRPRQLGDVMTVKATYKGLHLYVRSCELHHDGEGWRLTGRCPVTDARL